MKPPLPMPPLPTCRTASSTFTDRQATEATIADMDTKDSETITATQLAQVTEIKTWRSDGAED